MKGGKGAVLLEVLVALTILTLVAVPLLRLGRMGLRRVEAGRQRLEDARAAEGYLAEIAAGLRPLPAPASETPLRLGERDGRLRVQPGPAAGTVLLEIRCGSIRREALFPGGAVP